jgi:hypothetical protein
VTEETAKLDDRARDNWAMLFRIAEAAGGDWPRRAANAARVTSAKDVDEKQSAGVRLLADTRRVFEQTKADALKSDMLAKQLGALEEAPWGSYKGGKALSPRGIALLLKPFGISPNKRKDANYYVRHDFEDAWSRYL